MIVPRQHGESLDPLPERAAAVFRPGGALARGCETEGIAFEVRPQQEVMARAIGAALDESRHLAVEAGTGVGKSFAYLAPILLTVCENGARAAISTCTISLQEQLVRKDLPFLRRHLGLDFQAVLVKGRGNYLCRRRLSRAGRMGHDLFEDAEAAEIERIRDWAESTGDGSLQDLLSPPPPAVWDAVRAEEGNCLGGACPFSGRCFFLSARRQMHAANLLVVNHALLFSDLALRPRRAGFLPGLDILALDEAHRIENVAAARLGLRLTPFAFDHWMRRLFLPAAQKGLLSVVRDGEAAREVERLGSELQRLFRDLGAWAKVDAEHPTRTVREPLGLPTAVPIRISGICDRLRTLESGLEHDLDLKSEIRQARLRGAELRASLEAFLDRALEGHVYWIERAGSRRISLNSAPVDVAPLLKPLLFDEFPCVILTSATLAVNESLAYFLGRIGAAPCGELLVGSPFDYARQMRLEVAAGMPDPTAGDVFADAAAERIRRSVLRSHGAAFVLFTSAVMMRTVARRLRDPLAADGLRLLVQGEGLPRHAMLEAFRREDGQVLFGLDSFWMGVDVRGDALRNVVIVRLPFPVPDHPLAEARAERIRAEGGDAFRDYALPEAIIRFRQGVGRLIRTASDRGIVTVLDPRILTRGYGRWFLRSLPPDVPVGTDGDP